MKLQWRTYEITVARWISIVGHPFSFVMLLMLLAFRVSGEVTVLRAALVVLLMGILPLGWFFRECFVSGRWASVDASAQQDRPVLYLSLLAVGLPLGCYLVWIVQSPLLVRAGVAVAVTLGVACILNRWIKLSIHLVFAGFAMVLFAGASPVAGLCMGLFIPWLAWSRLVLLRHTLPEVVAGLVLGLLAGATLVLTAIQVY